MQLVYELLPYIPQRVAGLRSGETGHQIDETGGQHSADQQRDGQPETVQPVQTESRKQAGLAFRTETDDPTLPADIDSVSQPACVVPYAGEQPVAAVADRRWMRCATGCITWKTSARNTADPDRRRVP